MASAPKYTTLVVPQSQYTRIRTEQLDSAQAKLRAIRGITNVISAGFDPEPASVPRAEDLQETFDLIRNLAEEAYCELLDGAATPV